MGRSIPCFYKHIALYIYKHIALNKYKPIVLTKYKLIMIKIMIMIIKI